MWVGSLYFRKIPQVWKKQFCFSWPLLRQEKCSCSEWTPNACLKLSDSQILFRAGCYLLYVVYFTVISAKYALIEEYLVCVMFLWAFLQSLVVKHSPCLRSTLCNLPGKYLVKVFSFSLSCTAPKELFEAKEELQPKTFTDDRWFAAASRLSEPAI